MAPNFKIFFLSLAQFFISQPLYCFLLPFYCFDCQFIFIFLCYIVITVLVKNSLCLPFVLLLSNLVTSFSLFLLSIDLSLPFMMFHFCLFSWPEVAPELLKIHSYEFQDNIRYCSIGRTITSYSLLFTFHIKNQTSACSVRRLKRHEFCHQAVTVRICS